VLAIVHEDDAGPGVFAQAAHGCGVEMHPWRIAQGERPPGSPADYEAVLSLGGAMHAHEQSAHPWLADEIALLAELAYAGRPVLGVCLGAQLLSHAAGGSTALMDEAEIGWYGVELTAAGSSDPLLGPLAGGFRALQWHSCSLDPGPGAVTLARSRRCAQAFRWGARAWGIQFHAEVTAGDYAAWIDDAAPNGHGPRDPARLRASVRAGIGGWNVLGRELFTRFLAQAAGATA
jgi:GMP synthase (glutamine-hydrolysing)